MDHSANLYLLDRIGRLIGILPHGLPPQALVDAIRRALGNGSKASGIQTLGMAL